VAARASTNKETDGPIRLPAFQGNQTLEALFSATLRSSIGNGEIRPGQRISINEAAEQLGVSRLPVIHALRRLASEGFVVLRPHREVVAANPTTEEIRGRLLIMSALGGLAGREALPRLDDSHIAQFRTAHEEFIAAQREPIDPELSMEKDTIFHTMLWRAAEIPQLYNMLETLWDQGRFYRALYFKERQFIPARVSQHERILRAIEARDADELAEAITEHQLATLGRVTYVLEQRR